MNGTRQKSVWILRNGVCASPFQSLFAEPVPLGQGGHGHLLITGRALLGDFHLQISQKNSFSFLDFTFISEANMCNHSSLYPSCFSFPHPRFTCQYVLSQSCSFYLFI